MLDGRCIDPKVDRREDLMKVFGKKANTPTATVTEKFATVEETVELEEESATNYNDITSAETGIEANTARCKSN